MTELLDLARMFLNLVRKCGVGALEPEDEIGLAILGMSEQVLYKALPEGEPLRAERVLELDTWSLRFVMANDVFLAIRAGFLPTLGVGPKEEFHFAWRKYVSWHRSTLYPAAEAAFHADRSQDVSKRHAMIGFLWRYFVANGSAAPDIEGGLRTWCNIFKKHYGSDESITDEETLDALFWTWEKNSKRTDLLFVSRDHRLTFGKRQLEEAFERVAGPNERGPSSGPGALVHLEDRVQGREDGPELTRLDTVPDPNGVVAFHLVALRELQELRNRPELPPLLGPALKALEAANVTELLEAVTRIRLVVDLLQEVREPGLQAAIVCEGLGIDGRGSGKPWRRGVAEHYGISERQLSYRVETARGLLRNRSA